jgi:beta-glucosidase
VGSDRRSGSEFIWATGLEDTFVVHEASGRRRLDELELVGHYEAWREDVDRAAEIGFAAMRCGIPWYRVEPAPGNFDWTWTDQLLPYMAERGITPIADLIHYGTPLWMPDAFIDPQYPAAVSAYAGAFAERYASLVRHYTPVNEPGVTALICGYAGSWPPYLTGHGGYVRVLNALCRGIVGEVAAVRQSRPDAVIVHVEGTGFWLHAGAPDGSIGSVEVERIYAPLDLLTGSVTRAHELYPYLSSHGFTDEDFDWYGRHALMPDVIGINYYPDGSVHRRLPGADGDPDGMMTVWGGVEHLAQAIRDFHARYGQPIFISETGCNERSAAWVPWPGMPDGADRSAFRSWWLHDLTAMLRQAVADGLPVWGCTWWPLIDAVSWAYRNGTGELATYLEPGGLMHLGVEEDGQMSREPLAVGERLREIIRGWT